MMGAGKKKWSLFVDWNGATCKNGWVEIITQQILIFNAGDGRIVAASRGLARKILQTGSRINFKLKEERRVFCFQLLKPFGQLTNFLLSILWRRINFFFRASYGNLLFCIAGEGNKYARTEPKSKCEWSKLYELCYTFVVFALEVIYILHYVPKYKNTLERADFQKVMSHS